MSRRTNSPAYLKIALDIASRIVNGDFIEGKKLSGRSTLVGIYNVSPETIRRSIALLQDMDVVVVEEKSGITIKSKTNAGSFIEKFKTKNEFATQLRNVGLIVPYESLVEPNSLIIGKTLGELNFWNNTGATIIGVKREGKLYLSPGPYLAIKNGDIIVYVGESEVIENVNNYITSQVK